MKIKTTKLFGIKIWETQILEDKEEVRDNIKPKKVKGEGAVIDYSPEQAEYDRQVANENMLDGIKLKRGSGV